MKNCCCLFYGINNLQSLDLSSFNTQNVTNMSYMFNNCSKLEKLDLSSFNTPKLSNMSYMFYGCSNLQILDLSSFNTKNVIYRFNKGYIFDFCDKLEKVIISFEAPIISRYISKDKIIYA